MNQIAATVRGKNEHSLSHTHTLMDFGKEKRSRQQSGVGQGFANAVSWVVNNSEDHQCTATILVAGYVLITVSRYISKASPCRMCNTCVGISTSKRKEFPCAREVHTHRAPTGQSMTACC